MIDALLQVDPPAIAVHSRMPYAVLGKAADAAIVKNPRSIVNSPEIVTRLTLTADPANTLPGFALIFSLSHSVGDGHTYYKILNMLSVAGRIKPLNATRREEASPGMVDAVGKKEYGYLLGMAHFLNALRGVIFGRKARACAY